MKVQPHDTAFVDLASAIGPRELLETSLRNYSALSTVGVPTTVLKYFEVVGLGATMSLALIHNICCGSGANNRRCRLGILVRSRSLALALTRASRRMHPALIYVSVLI